MVFLQGTARDSGPAAALLRLWEDNAFTLLASGEVLLEIEDVLSRPKIRRVNPRLAERRVRDLMARLRHQTLWPEVRSVHVHLPRDPKDEKYLNLAVAGRADYPVSWDQHLMGLRSDDTPEAVHFREVYPAIRIVTPVEFLQAISASVR
jgi:putative PIN family toxin of toxin-antitoxin system